MLSASAAMKHSMSESFDVHSRPSHTPPLQQSGDGHSHVRVHPGDVLVTVYQDPTRAPGCTLDKPMEDTIVLTRSARLTSRSKGMRDYAGWLMASLGRKCRHRRGHGGGFGTYRTFFNPFFGGKTSWCRQPLCGHLFLTSPSTAFVGQIRDG